MLISVIFSFRNEQDNIPELLRRVTSSIDTLADYNYELVFVNDSSIDQSLDLLRRYKFTYPIRIVNMSRRFGVTPCVIAGLNHARGDLVIYMDSDLQDPPELIPEMVHCFENGADVVHTRRTMRLGESRLKMYLTKLAYKTINFFSDIELPANVGDFKLLSRRAVDKILELKEIDLYMRGLSVWVGFNQVFIDYVREPRFQGNTHFPLLSKGPVNEFLRGITAFSAGPLYLSFFFSLFTLLFAVFFSIYAIYSKIIGVSAPGSSGLIILICFLIGAVLMSNGIMGVYIAKIYYEVKSRPRSIVESVE